MSEIISFLTVLLVAILVAGSVSSLYALGLRLWLTANAQGESASHVTFRIASVICFAGCVCIVLYALWLMIPIFH